MIVRAADYDRDAAAILAGARDFIGRMTARDFAPQDDDELARALDFMSTMERFEIFVAEHEGCVVGGIGLLFAPLLWRRNVTAMTEMFIWTAPDAPGTTFLGLLRAAEKRRAALGVGLREYGALESSPPGIERVYARMGLVKTQTSWMGAG